MLQSRSGDIIPLDFRFPRDDSGRAQFRAAIPGVPGCAIPAAPGSARRFRARTDCASREAATPEIFPNGKKQNLGRLFRRVSEPSIN
jgi:hypothetical protein